MRRNREVPKVIKFSVPLWAKITLLWLAFLDLFHPSEKLSGNDIRKPTAGFRHWNSGINRWERTYGNAIQHGAYYYTFYYRIWFGPFTVRTWPMFDYFIDPMLTDITHLSPWDHSIVNPKSGKRVTWKYIAEHSLSDVLRELNSSVEKAV